MNAAVRHSTPDIAGLRKVIQAIECVPEEQFEMGITFGWSRCAIGHVCRAAVDDKKTMTLNLTGREMEALEELTAKKEMSKTAILGHPLPRLEIVPVD